MADVLIPQNDYTKILGLIPRPTLTPVAFQKRRRAEHNEHQRVMRVARAIAKVESLPGQLLILNPQAAKVSSKSIYHQDTFFPTLQLRPRFTDLKSIEALLLSTAQGLTSEQQNLLHVYGDPTLTKIASDLGDKHGIKVEINSPHAAKPAPGLNPQNDSTSDPKWKAEELGYGAPQLRPVVQPELNRFPVVDMAPALHARPDSPVKAHIGTHHVKVQFNPALDPTLGNNPNSMYGVGKKQESNHTPSEEQRRELEREELERQAQEQHMMKAMTAAASSA